MAITCPRCGAGFDATLFQFGHGVRCGCGAEVEYPGADLRGGHVVAQGDDKAVSHEDRCVGSLLGTACGDILGAAAEGMAASEPDTPKTVEPGVLRQTSLLSEDGLHL